MENQGRRALLETGFLVGLFAVNFLGSDSVDPSKQDLAILIRVLANVVCISGLIAIYVLKSRDKGKASPDSEDASVSQILQGGNDLAVTYQSTREATWRCNLHIFFHSSSSLLTMAVVGMIPALLVAPAIYQRNASQGIIAFLGIWALGALGWVAFFCLIVFAQIAARFPSPSTVRICTSTLTPQGFRDETPGRTKTYPWSQIISIREHHGDVYIGAVGGGSFIPCSAFKNVDEARNYYRAAMALWKSRGDVWPESKTSPENFPSGNGLELDSDNPYVQPRAPIGMIGSKEGLTNSHSPRNPWRVLIAISIVSLCIIVLRILQNRR